MLRNWLYGGSWGNLCTRYACHTEKNDKEEYQRKPAL